MINSVDKATNTWRCWVMKGFPGGTSGKEPACQCRRHKRHGFNPWVRKISWRRKWQPTSVFLPGESHGQHNLEGYSPWGHTETPPNQLSTDNKFYYVALETMRVWECYSCSYKSSQTFSHNRAVFKSMYSYLFICIFVQFYSCQPLYFVRLRCISCFFSVSTDLNSEWDIKKYSDDNY